MSRPSRGAWLLGALCLLGGCDQLGNPPPFATKATEWTDGNGVVVTTTRSFRDEKTIRRLAAEGFDALDYADSSIGPSQTLTLVSVVPRSLRMTGRPRVTLVTTFRLRGGAPLTRRWSAPASSRRWSAAFAMPEPPQGAVTSVVP
ncbi:MAG: hypothetical protein OEN21_09835 [Myxococcales bacterium]|nr:hypothetical protein [Myxococcales bacterium]